MASIISLWKAHRPDGMTAITIENQDSRGHDEQLKVIAKSCEKPREAQRWTARDITRELPELGVSKTTVDES